MSIINQRTNANAAQTAPEVGRYAGRFGQSLDRGLRIRLDQLQLVGGRQGKGGASTLTIDPAWNGKQITLIVDVAAGCPYNGSKQPHRVP